MTATRHELVTPVRLPLLIPYILIGTENCVAATGAELVGTAQATGVTDSAAIGSANVVRVTLVTKQALARSVRAARACRIADRSFR